MIKLLAILAVIILVFLLILVFPIVQICGSSMYPTLKDGEFYLGKRVFRKSRCKIGGVYIFKPPYDSPDEKYVIKRLSGFKQDKGRVSYFFLGDNPNESYDSRYYGYVDCSLVVAQIYPKNKEV